jgi:hypothetical protein
VTIHSGSRSPPPKKPPWWKSAWAIAIGAAGIIAAVVAVLTYFHLQPSGTADTKVSVTSTNQSGGITAYTVNIGPQNRTLSGPQSDALKARILKGLSRTKPITITSLMNDSEAYRFAAEIRAFLAAEGFTFTGNEIPQGVFVPPPTGLTVSDTTH